MSSGKAHARASKLLALPAALGVGAFCQWVGDYWIGSLLAGSGAAFGCLSGIILSPDLDVRGLTKSEHVVTKILGPFSIIFVAYFWIYAWVIPHRCALSHYPVIGTAGRIVYLLGPLFALKRDWITEKVTAEIAIVLCGMAVGLLASDLAHYFMDFFPKRKKRRRRSRRYRA